MARGSAPSGAWRSTGGTGRVSGGAACVGAFLTGHNERITFAHCEFRGGVPTWMFRSDIKDVYRFRTSEG